ncbi:MAG: hypothetical protein ABJ015_15560, partial [Rhodopirellula bahusiensis]
MIRSNFVILYLSAALIHAQALPAFASTSGSHQSTAMQFIRTGLLERDVRGVNDITLPGIAKTIWVTARSWSVLNSR